MPGEAPAERPPTRRALYYSKGSTLHSLPEASTRDGEFRQLFNVPLTKVFLAETSESLDSSPALPPAPRGQIATALPSLV